MGNELNESKLLKNNTSPTVLQQFSIQFSIETEGFKYHSQQFSTVLPYFKFKKVYLNSFKLKIGENCGELLGMVLKAFTFNGELCGELLENCWRSVIFFSNLDSFSSFPTFNQSHNQLNQSKHSDKLQDDVYSSITCKSSFSKTELNRQNKNGNHFPNTYAMTDIMENNFAEDRLPC